MSEYLPEEVLVEIFLRLPIKSIIQCTSVCKSWYAFITSPSFISSHLNYQDEHLLVRRCYVDPKEHRSPRYWKNPPAEEIYALYNDNENFDKYIQFSDVPPKCTYFHFNIVGSCNGLLCLSDDLFTYPNVRKSSIRKSLKLPEPIFAFETHVDYVNILGFGFDPITNDYKVVRIVHKDGGCCGCCEVRPHVELYKLSTGVWQDITHIAPPLKLFRKRSGVFMNGACHWAAYGSRKIVLFDVLDETFREMMLPGNVEVGCWFGDEWGRLFESEESLCFSDRLFDNDRTIDIWRMKVYGDSESWVKQYSIDAHITFSIVDEFYSWFQREGTHFLLKPLASRRNGEILWRADNGNLVSYDIATEKIKNLGIHNTNFFPLCDALYVSNTYKVSLILLDKRTVYFAEKYGKKVSGKVMSSRKHKKNDSDDDADESGSRKRKKRGRSKRSKSGKRRGHSEESDEDKDHRKRRKEKRRKRDESSDDDDHHRRRKKSRKENRRRRSYRHTDSSAESTDDSPPRHNHRSRKGASVSDSDSNNSDDARVGRDKKRYEKRSRKRHDVEEY